MGASLLALAKSMFVIETYLFYPGALVKMYNFNKNSSVREWNWKKPVFIERNNMRWVEIYFGNLIIFVEVHEA